MSKLTSLLLTLCSVLALAQPAAACAAPAQAEPAPPVPRPAYAPGGPGLLPFAPGVAIASSSPQDYPFPLDTSVFNWSRLAFESYRDGNWDIYSMRPDGTDLRRLTKSRAIEARPRQSRADGRVAFISDRAGNFDIFSVAADGSDLHQLTADLADDNYPSWSPDGKRIAFASNRSGSWDLYVMNADGSNVTRFMGGPDIDFAPSWSPDGATIAFVRVSQGDLGRIWLANPDGTNARPLSNDVRWPANPVWSPDGKWIAFEHDYNRNGNYDIAKVRADGSDPLFVPVRSAPDPLTDVFLGSYSPHNKLLSFSIVKYVVIDDELYIGSAEMAYTRHDDQGYDTPHLFPGSGIDLLPDWQRSDFTAPRTRMLTMPALAAWGIGARLEWDAADSGGSGIVGYQLEYRRANGPWQPAYHGLLTDTWTIVGLEPGEAWFRVRAIDAAGNEERWPSSPAGDGKTIFYKDRATGSLYDNRHTPIPGVRVGGATVPDGPFFTGPDGSYDIYAYDSLGAVTFAHPAYGPLPPFVLRPANGPMDGALPPLDNAVTNGDFEESLTGWTASLAGEADLTHPHTGSGGLALIVYDAVRTVQIAQSIKVPPAAVRPTLSFFMSRDISEPPGEILTAKVKVGAAAATVLPLHVVDPQEWGWNHAWADLTPWAGKAVKIIFEVKQESVGDWDIIRLDDVSVGGWHTPRIIQVERAAEPAGMIVVRGENFEPGAVASLDGAALTTTFVDAQTLTAVVPPGAPVGTRAVWVTNPGGQQALGEVRLGLPFFLPAVEWSD